MLRICRQDITYPGYYTFSCSGHPLDDVGEEFVELDANGVKLAAQRRLNAELGISKQDVPIREIYYLTRIYHMNPGNGVWGDHEICYILIIQADCKLKPNPGEISEFSLIPKGQLSTYLSTLDSPVTPLFQKIIRCRLELWWNNLDDLDSIKDHKHIMMFT